MLSSLRSVTLILCRPYVTKRARLLLPRFRRTSVWTVAHSLCFACELAYILILLKFTPVDLLFILIIVMRLSVIELRVVISLDCRVLLRWTCLHVLMFCGVTDSLTRDLVAPGPSDKLLKTSLEKPIKQRLVIRSLQAVPAPRCHRAITPACAVHTVKHMRGSCS